MDRYSRNRIYVSDAEEAKIRRTRIFLAGAGIGSMIAECALRIGFEKMVIVDGDNVELSNLNRQNYVVDNIGMSKSESLAQRLRMINTDVDIRTETIFLNENNIAGLLDGCDIAVNALDFKDKTPFVFDEMCAKRKIPVLHPYNFGWAGFVTIVHPDGRKVSDISDNPLGFELKMAKYVLSRNCQAGVVCEWMQDVVDRFERETGSLPPPQLSVGNFLAAGLSTRAMCAIATGKKVKYFPEFYFNNSV